MNNENIAILAHGKNWEVPVPADPAAIQLSIESSFTAEAAGLLFLDGVAPNIILSTGFTAGTEYPSEAAAMRVKLRQKFSTDQIPDEALLMEESSFDTVGNFRAVQTLCEEQGIDGLVLLSIGYHLPRARYLAKHLLKVPVIGAYKSDYVVAAHQNPPITHAYGRNVLRQAAGRHSIKPLIRTVASYALEAAAWGVAIVDPSGDKISTKATSRIRNQ